MASDAKRQNAAPKPTVALPNAPPPAMVSIETALGAAVGAQIRVTTAAPKSATYEGTLFTADPTTNLIVLNTAPTSSSTGDYHIIPVSRLQSFSIVSLPRPNGESSFANAVPQIAALNISSLRAREESAIRRLKDQELKKGKNVTSEAQEIFNALDRTMPARWVRQDIVISDSVVISKPYRIEDCRPVDDKVSGSAVHRVRKVLEMERKKIELRKASANLSRATAGSGNVNGQRKGG